MNQSYIVPLNLSKLGFRYFRIVLESKHFSKRFIEYVTEHPNTGYVFAGTGWSGKKRILGIGIWATSNSEIADISTAIRAAIPHAYKVVYQSELTRLEYFSTSAGERHRMVLVDELEQKISLSPLELDFLKLLSIDGSLQLHEQAAILGLSETEVANIDTALRQRGVFYGVLHNPPLPPGYTKFFVDTTSLSHQAVDALFSTLETDTACVYIARGNGVYNIEFEYVLHSEADFLVQYGQYLTHSKRITFDHNVFTNLFPHSKSLNTKQIQERFLQLASHNDTEFDFSDSALWYVNREGAQEYLDIHKNASYRQSMHTGEVTLFPEVTTILSSLAPHFNIIDLGSGDGKKGKEFIQQMQIDRIRAYFPVDVQELELAQAVRQHEPVSYAVHPTILRFSTLGTRFPLATRTGESSVYMLLGGTYGNFDVREINAQLRPLLQYTNDRLLVGIGIRDYTSRTEIAASYLAATMEGMAFGVLKHIGFSRADFMPNSLDPALIMQLRWEGNRLRSYFTLKHHTFVHGVPLAPGTTFYITSSWKPTLTEFRDALSRDFQVESIVSNKHFAIAICSRQGSTVV